VAVEVWRRVKCEEKGQMWGRVVKTPNLLFWKSQTLFAPRYPKTIMGNRGVTRVSIISFSSISNVRWRRRSKQNVATKRYLFHVNYPKTVMGSRTVIRASTPLLAPSVWQQHCNDGTIYSFRKGASPSLCINTMHTAFSFIEQFSRVR
jgi:hypothetical protein